MCEKKIIYIYTHTHTCLLLMFKQETHAQNDI